MPEIYNWKKEILARIARASEREEEIDPQILEELAQHLEFRYEELGSYDAVMSEWSPADLCAELARIQRRRRAEPPAWGTPSWGTLSRTLPAGPAPAASSWTNPFAGCWQDIRYGLRQLRLNPAFAAVAIFSLALGIGANTAVFQLLDAVRLRSLPVANPQELAIVRIADKKAGRSGDFTSRFPHATYAMWQGFRQEQRVFSGVVAWGTSIRDLSTNGEARLTRDALFINGDFFKVLGVPAMMGRVFTDSDDQPGCPGSVVISHAFWQRQYGGDPSVLGRKISLDGHSLEIIGVTPPSFYGLEVGRSYDLAVPLCSAAILDPEQKRLERKDIWWLAFMGRLKPGVSLEQANAQLAAISPGIFAAAVHSKWQPVDAKAFLNFKLGAFPSASGWSDLRQQYEDPLWMLLATAGMVLLIACANLANLMLARASARQRELAVRLALGASRARLIRQLLAESLLLAFFGTVAGALLAQRASNFLLSFLSTENTPVFVDLATDWRVFGFLAALAILTTLLFGLIPAWRATRTSPAAVMKAGGRGVAGTNERIGFLRVTLGQVLVVSQVALSLVLLIGSFLFVRSLSNLLTLDAGFQQDGILIAGYDTGRLKQPKSARIPMAHELLAKVRATPGVESAAYASIVPVSGNGWNSSVWMEGVANAAHHNVNFNRISEGYFRTVGTPLLAGRDFDDRDNASAPPRALVTEAFARKLTGGANPVGRRFRVEKGAGDPDLVCEIIGLVHDAKYGDLRDAFQPEIFLSLDQDTDPDSGGQFMIRSSLPLAPLTTSLRQVFAETNPNIGYAFQNFRTQILETLRRERLLAALSGLFGVLAVALAMAGLYGVVSYTVARRTNEIGVRMALGANRSRIQAMILGEAGLLLAAGLLAGSALSFYAVRFAASLLFNLQARDPLTYAGCALALALVATAASYLPARRAARLDPMAALRDE